ncbi:MAG: hypothetical protein ACFFDY_01485 [Candidatus Thorarchaeota archaeon]
MKIPEQDGYYRFYDVDCDKNTVVKKEGELIFYVYGDHGYSIKEEMDYGSYFLEPIEPIKFD